MKNKNRSINLRNELFLMIFSLPYFLVTKAWIEFIMPFFEFLVIIFSILKPQLSSKKAKFSLLKRQKSKKEIYTLRFDIRGTVLLYIILYSLLIKHSLNKIYLIFMS